MLAKTRGIVLHHLKYGDSGIIAHIYTEDYGRKSFLIKGARSKRSKSRSAVFQPLFALNLEFYNKEGKDLLLTKEISLAKNFISFPYNINKSAQAMFLAEVLYKTLKEEEKNQGLFLFLLNSIEYFDLHEKGSSNFHLIFLLKLTRFLGILPFAEKNGEGMFFDIKEGTFNSSLPLHFEFVNEKMAGMMNNFLKANYEGASEFKISRNERNELLHEILRFYSFHHFKVDDLKSIDVLKELFR